ncbi:MAG: hypothetical protein QOI05_4720 [Bradyrhizobium sp.]|jgi:nucleoside phosphorylase|nr:hypothetical protein [Bradyrhizobium sp.]
MKFEDSSQILAKTDAEGLRRVLVVTALPSEMAAVRKHTKHIGSCQGRDGNIFELGQFDGTGSQWLVVVGESGAGNHPSQGIVTNASIQFGPFELILFVGVAATRKVDDAPIGSVVISNHVYLASVGKYKEGDFFSRSREFPTDLRLVGFGRKVVRDEKWHERLVPPFAGLLPDNDQYPKPFPPAAIIAPIVSTEAVSADIDSVLERQITAAYQDATALEMEGYGVLYAAFSEGIPSIVIRGISDDRAGKDPVLDKMHQPIAAAHAAAFAYELIDLWGHNQPSLCPMPIMAGPAKTEKSTSTTTLPPLHSIGSFQVVLVLNFAGSNADFPRAKQQQIVDALREITGNPDLTLLGSQVGSFHLFVKAARSDLTKLQSTKTREQLSQAFDVTLLGVMTEPEFQSASTDKSAFLNASKALLEWPKSLPDGTSIERPELERLLAAPDGNEGTTSAVLGDPGSGKSALLASLAHALKLAEVPFLAIKADFLDPNIVDEEGLRTALGLPALPSTLLRRLSNRGPVYLIIDQLDALAGYVDLRTGRLSALLNLVREVGSERNIHIVLSARRFEYEHDTRLKTVRAESIQLELPPWSTVLKILEANGVKAAGWPLDAQDVMRSPQSLATFLRFTDPTTAEPFSKYQKMLEQLWVERLIARPDGKRISKLAGVIAEDMAEKETLWLARSRYDDVAEDLETLIGETILTTPAGSPGSIGFSHQTVFEFALARSFAQKEGRLSSYIAARETSLFIRPKLWAALTYLRGVELASYEAELHAIWYRPNLRLHLRHLLIEFLGQQSDPHNAEAEVVFSALKSDDRRTALQAIIGSKGWFARFKSTEISKAMLNEPEAGVAAAILSRASEFAPADVLTLVEKHWMQSKEFDRYAWPVLQDIPTWTEDHLRLVTTMIERTEIAAFTFDHMVSTVGASQPTLAIRLVLVRLRALLRAARVEAEVRKQNQSASTENEESLSRYLASPVELLNGLVEGQSDGWDALEALAKSDASNFLSFLWPWLQEVLEAIKEYKEDMGSEISFPLLYAPDFRFEDEGTLDLPEPSVLGAFRTAAETLAAQDPEKFLSWLHTVENDEAVPPQRLLAHALGSQPERFASELLSFLISDKRRFNLGSVEDISGTTKRVVGAVSPFWSDEQLREFIDAVKSYSPRPDPERTAESRRVFYRIVERIRFELLTELPSERLPADAQTIVKEGTRKFGGSKRGATFSGVQWVGSPMSAVEISRATEDAVLKAFETLPDATGWDNPKTWQKGGNVQLSRAFAEFSKENPLRAIQIMGRFNPEIGTRAAGYAIDAMAEKEDANLLLPLIHDLDNRGFEGDEYRGSVARAIEKLINREFLIDDKTLEILQVWLSSPIASSEGNDSASEANRESESSEEKDHADSILWGMGGISILPHGNFPILETLTRVLLQRKNYLDLLSILANHLKQSEDQKIWTALMRLFPFIHAEANELMPFYEALFAKYPHLVEQRETAILLAQLHWKVPDFVHELLVKWEENSSAFVQQAFGELVTLIWLVRPELEWPENLIGTILASDASSPARTGATFAAIHIWAETDDKQRAADLLQKLIKGAADKTWKAAIDIFRLVDDITPEEEWVKILQAIADEIPNHTWFMSSFIIDRLQGLLPHEAPLVASIAQVLVAKWQSELGDLRTGTAAIAPELVDIAITLHRLGPQTRDQGLQIFESLLAINAYTARETLDQVDNRFRTAQPSPRRRLPRRQQRARRRRRVA